MGLLDELREGSAEAENNTGGDFAPAWRWDQPGDGVEGIVVSVTSRTHENHPDGYPIVTIRQENGEDIAVHCMAYVLKNEITERRPRPGDEFAVVYDGKKNSAQGRSYNAFRVATRNGSGQVPPAAAKSEQEQNAGPGWNKRNEQPKQDAWNNPAEVPF